MDHRTPYEDPLANLYAHSNDDFQALVRYATGIDEELLYSSGMKGFVVDLVPTKGLPCALKPDVRSLILALIDNGRIVIRKNVDAVHVTLKPVKRTSDLSHPFDNRTKTQRKKDKERRNDMK